MMEGWQLNCEKKGYQWVSQVQCEPANGVHAKHVMFVPNSVDDNDGSPLRLLFAPSYIFCPYGESM